VATGSAGREAEVIEPEPGIRARRPVAGEDLQFRVGTGVETDRELAVRAEPAEVRLREDRPATARRDRTVRLWDTDPGRAAARVCSTAEPVITESEGNRSLPDIAFRRPCP
jgi:hypothetical protein